MEPSVMEQSKALGPLSTIKRERDGEGEREEK